MTHPTSHLSHHDPRKSMDWSYRFDGTFVHDQVHATRPHARCARMFDRYYQGNAQSCTAQALARLYRQARLRRGRIDLDPSRAWIYAEERIRRGNFPLDAGASLGDGLWIMSHKGVLAEAAFPYDAARVTDPDAIPPLTVLDHRLHDYYRADHTSVAEIRTALGAERPFVIMLKIYQSFEDAADGNVPMPNPAKERLLGNHAIYVDGHDEFRYTFLNWWEGWGGADGGGTLPAEYLHHPDLASSVWIAGSVS